jgi:hypothetical protein
VRWAAALASQSDTPAELAAMVMSAAAMIAAAWVEVRTLSLRSPGATTAAARTN